MFNLTDNKRINWKYQKLGNLGVFKTSSIDKIIKDNQRLVNLVNYMDVYNKIRFDISCLNRLSKTSVNDKQFLESNLKKGDILLFPSTFLYPHRVEQVKKGTRYSFVTWAF